MTVRVDHSQLEASVHFPDMRDVPNNVVTGQRLQLKHAGFDPLPVNGKAALLKEWTTLKISAADITRWERGRPR